MRTSESTTKLTAAYVAAQQEMGHPARKSKNPHLHNEFADLPTVIDEVKPVLTKHGLAAIQSVGGAGGVVTVTTRLMHVSGEWIEDTIERPVEERKGLTIDQVAGCTVTYMRRYQLSAMCCVASEPDDDGSEAKAPPEEKPKRTMRAAAAKRADPAPEPGAEPKPDIKEWRRTFFARIRGEGLFDDDAQRKLWCEKFSGKTSTAEWTAQEFIAAVARLDAIKDGVDFQENLGRHE